MNGNYKLVYAKQTDDIKNLILNSYPLHTDLGEKLRSIIKGGYRYCPICDNVMIWKTEARTCSKECATKSFLKNKEKTNMERYGVKDASLLPEVRQKMKDTNLKKFGTEYAIGSDKLQKKIRKTNLEKYGVEYPLESKDVREKGKATCVEKYGVEYPSLLEEFSSKALNTRKRNGNYQQYISYPEKLICTWLDELHIEYVTNTRSVIHPYEIDIYIPSYKLAIEFNGSFWHSEKFIDKNYHQNKSMACNKKGIDLLHIYEYFFYDHVKLYKNIVKLKLGEITKINNELCEIEVVNSVMGDKFHKKHNFNYIKGDVCIGLKYKGELATLISFIDNQVTSFTTSYVYDIIDDVEVIIQYYKEMFNFSEVIFNKDLSIYNNTNINKSNLIEPKYIWSKNNLIASPALSNDCSGLTEDADMYKDKFYKIYDSGSYKVVY